MTRPKCGGGTVRANIAANFAGKAWTAVLSLLFIPLYVHYLGIESYGLVGVFAALSAVSGVMDLGLKTTVNRELARISADPGGDPGEGRILVRTLEVVYWSMAVIIGGAVVLAAPSIVDHWIRYDRLSPDAAVQSIRLMGVSIALGWPFAFYSGGLLGLQRHVGLNVLTVAVETVRGVGAVLILHFVSPTIQVFFLWQSLASVSMTALGAAYLWRVLPGRGETARFDPATLRRCWNFAAGMSGLSVLVVLLSQVDKIVLSRLLRFDQFGYYVLAVSVARPSTFLVNGVYTAIFPRMSQLYYARDRKGLVAIYHKGAQLVSVVLLPVAVVVGLYSSEVLYGWTGKVDIVANCHRIVVLLMIAYALDALLVVPQALQLSHGATRFLLVQTLASLCVVVPLMIHLSGGYGAEGGAISWVLVSAATVLVAVPVVHRLFLKGELARWCFQDLILPLAGTLAVAIPGRHFMPAGLGRVASLAWVAVSLALAFICAFACAPTLRREAYANAEGWLNCRSRKDV